MKMFSSYWFELIKCIDNEIVQFNECLTLRIINIANVHGFNISNLYSHTWFIRIRYISLFKVKICSAISAFSKLGKGKYVYNKQPANILCMVVYMTYPKKFNCTCGTSENDFFQIINLDYIFAGKITKSKARKKVLMKFGFIEVFLYY